MLLLFYLAGVVTTLVLFVRIVGAVFSSRIRSDITKHRIFNAAILQFVLIFWFIPWHGPLGYIAGTIASYCDRLTLYRPPFQAPPQTKIAFSEIIKDRYNIICPPIRGCMVISFKDSNYEQAHDQVILAEIHDRFDHDVISECKLAAINQTTTP